MASRLSLFLAELKRRKVYRVATVYVVVGAGIIGLCEAALPSDIWQGLQIPIGVIILIGLPIALVLAWAYEVKPEEPRPRGKAEQKAGPLSGAPTPVPSPNSVPPAKVAEEEERKSIAVLPFVDMSPDRDQEYFCDGMAEELINALTKVRGLRVAARTSSFYFKGKSEHVREIGRVLEVKSVLEGSVRRAGDRLRVTAQLVSVEAGYHLWSESYDRELKDVFAIQDEISRSIVETLRPKLLGDREDAADQGMPDLVVASTRSMEAYDQYLLGRHYWENRYKEGLAAALRHFQKAVELDPEFALPYTGVADSYTILGMFEYLKPEDARHRAMAAAQHALELDDRLSDAHASMGLYQFYLEWDFENAALAFEEALELNPEHGKAHVWLGLLRAEQGRFDEAFHEVGVAQSLDPLSSYIAVNTACVHALAGDPARASEMLERIVARDAARDPNVLLAAFFLGWSYTMMSKHDLAVALAEKAVTLSNDAGHFKGALGSFYGRAGMHDKARTVLAELLSRQASQHVSPLWLSWIHLGLGEKEEALDLLARAVAERSPYLQAVQQDLTWQPVWSDPRFRELASKVGSGIVSRAWEREWTAGPEIVPTNP